MNPRSGIYLASALISILVLSFVIVKVTTGKQVSVTPSQGELAQVSGAGSNLVGWWTFDEGGGTTAADSSGNNTTMNIYSAGWGAGIVGSGSLSFSGSNYAQTPGSVTAPAGPITLSFWAKVPSTTTSGGLVSFNDLVFCSIGRVTVNSVNCTVNGASGNTTNAAYTTSAINDNAWHLITFVNSGSSQALYFDGTQQGTAANSFAGTSGSVSVGAFAFGSQGIAGSIDDVRIYTRALSVPEVGQLYAMRGGSGGGGGLITYTLSVTNSNGAGGSVTSNPSGINCGSTCTLGSLSSGSTVTLTASPNANFTTSWSGCASSSGNACTVSIGSANVSVTVNFTASGVTPAPTISAIQAGSITQSGATITWTTDQSADSLVNFGTTASYGNNSGLNSSLVTTHSTSLSGLTANTTYHFQVVSKNANGTTNSSDQTFTTLAQQSGGTQTCEAAAGSKCWYIDNAASGANTGASWANAWTSFDRQSPLGQASWSMIKPGDYVYISGGTVSQTYSGIIEPGVSGLQGKPITIRIGQDPGHNGKVILDGGYRNDSTGWYGLSIIDQSYINVTGQVGSDPTPRIEITHHYDDGIYVIRSSYAIHLSYMEVDTNGFDPWTDKHFKSTQPSFDPDAEGVFFSVNQRNDVLGEVDHLSIHGNNGDAARFTEFNADSSNVSNFGLLKIHDNDIYDFRADAVKISLGGTDFYNNHEHDRGIHVFDHPDGIQFWSSYVRIFNNTFNNFDNSAYILPGYDDLSGSNSYMRYNPGEGGDADHNPRYVYIYNNLFYEPTSRVLTTGNTNRGIELSFHSLSDAAVASVAHIYVANNLFSGVQFFTVGLSLHRDIPTNANDLAITNNIFLNSGPLSLDPGYLRATTYGGTGSGASVIIDNNAWYNIDPSKLASAIVVEEGVVGNPSSSQSTFYSYSGFKSLFPNSAFPGFLTPGFQAHDVTVDPKVDVAGLTFTSQTGSPVLDAGTSMSTAFTSDRNGITRPQGSAWDIGPYEGVGSGGPPPSGNPVLQLNFEGDNFAAGTFSDKSGKGNNANCQAGFALNGTTYNQCPTQATGPDGSTATKFVGNLCNMASDYLAVPTNTSFDNLTQGSLSIWGAFDDNSNTNLDQKLLDTLGGAFPNTWELGRDGAPYLTFTANTDFNALVDLFTFPGSYEPLGSWNNYVVTWDGSTVKGYYNGRLFRSVPQTFFSKFKLGTYLTLGALNHGDPRNTPDNNCVTYYGADPTKNYVQPNGDFLIGKLDDVRIYNRALTSSEVTAIAAVASVPSNTYILSVTKSGAGVGSVSGTNIDCGKHCAEAYPSGTSVTLMAIPQEGSNFAGWSGACTGTGTCTVNMSGDKSVSASFGRSYPIVATLEAESGTIASPYVSTGGVIYQDVLTTNPLSGGKASYTFTAPTAGDYLVSAVFDAPSDSSNSVFINIDGEPSTSNAWLMSTTGGFEEQIASWGGSTDGGNPPHAFTLSAGTHTLVLRGRENGTYIDKLYVMQKSGGGNSQADPSLVLHLDFSQDWSSSHSVADTSGAGNTATCQTSFTVVNANFFGLTPQTITANQCPAQTVGPVAGMQSATFNGQVCRLDSKYFAIQPNSSLNNLTRGSIALWGYFNPQTDPMFTFHTIWTFQKFLDTYINGTPNTWSLGKDFLNDTVLNVTNDSGTNHVYPIEFPDANASGWHHYVVTWDGTNFSGYYDGILVATTPQTGVSKLALGQYLAVGAMMHGDPQNDYTNNCTIQYSNDIAQYGYPSNQQYVMPNAGFLEGKMADVRIYNRALSSSDVTTLFSGQIINPPVDTTAPTVSITAPTNGSTVSGAAVSVSANASDNVGGSGMYSVQFKLDGANLGSELFIPPYSGTWNTTGVSNGAHALTAVARDASNNSATSNAVNVTVNNIVLGPDITSPSVPANLSATAVSSSQINLSWSASTDPTISGAVTSGVAGYKIYRGGTLLTTVTGTSYSNTGLNSSTLYSYKVQSYDAATPANVSIQSSFVSATTQSPPPPPNPPVPSNGSPTGSLSAGTTQVTLSLSTDKAAVCKYSTQANTAYSSMTGIFGTTGGTSHSTSIGNLSNGSTYTYYIKCDSSGLTTAGDYLISFSISNPPVTPPNNGTGGNGDAGSNGGGGTGTFTPTVPQPLTPPSTGPGGTCTPTFATSTLPALPTFTPPLIIGSRGPNVITLQTFLVSKGYLTRDLITGYYGVLTNAAVTKYNTDRNTKIPVKTCPGPNLPPGTSRLPKGFTFTTSLAPSSTSINVKNLQIFLNDHGYTVATKGLGSKGLESTYFGPATKAALTKFQEYYAKDILIPAGLLKGTGYFGPGTMKKVNQLIATGK